MTLEEHPNGNPATKEEAELIKQSRPTLEERIEALKKKGKN